MSARPRVLHVIGSLDIGGAERQIVEFVRGLAGPFESHVGLPSSGGPLEAMSSGHAIVTTTVGGSVEQIENGANGFVVPPHSPVSLAAARLLGDRSMREAFGTAARKTAIGKFGLERVLEETAALYERLAAQSRGSGNPAGASGP